MRGGTRSLVDHEGDWGEKGENIGKLPGNNRRRESKWPLAARSSVLSKYEAQEKKKGRRKKGTDALGGVEGGGVTGGIWNCGRRAGLFTKKWRDGRGRT